MFNAHPVIQLVIDRCMIKVLFVVVSKSGMKFVVVVVVVVENVVGVHIFVELSFCFLLIIFYCIGCWLFIIV